VKETIPISSDPEIAALVPEIILASEWREAVEEGLGLEQNVEEHTKKWAREIIQRMRDELAQTITAKAKRTDQTTREKAARDFIAGELEDNDTRQEMEAAIRAVVPALSKREVQALLAKCDHGSQHCSECPAFGCCDNTAIRVRGSGDYLASLRESECDPYRVLEVCEGEEKEKRVFDPLYIEPHANCRCVTEEIDKRTTIGIAKEMGATGDEKTKRTLSDMEEKEIRERARKALKVEQITTTQDLIDAIRNRGFSLVDISTDDDEPVFIDEREQGVVVALVRERDQEKIDRCVEDLTALMPMGIKVVIKTATNGPYR
jgi:hypothetical protein